MTLLFFIAALILGFRSDSTDDPRFMASLLLLSAGGIMYVIEKKMRV